MSPDETDVLEDDGRRPRLRPWMAALLFVVTTLAFTGWPLFTGSAMGGTDILQWAHPYEADVLRVTTGVNPIQTDLLEHMPMVIEFWEGVQEGHFQLWEPDVGAGVPLGAVTYTRALAPWFLPGAFLPLHLITTVAIVLGVLVAQFGTYGLARRLGLRIGGATLAAVAWTFSGPVITNLLRIQDLFLLPLLLYAIHGAVTAVGRRARYLALTGLVSAGTWAAGFPSVDLYMLYLALGFSAYVAVTGTDRSHRWSRRLVAAGRSAVPAAAATVLGVGLMAFQLLPTREFLEHSGVLDRAFGTDYTAGVAMLADAVSGRFFGAYQDTDWWWPDTVFTNPAEAASTVGLVVLGLLVALVVGLGRCGPDERRVDRDLRRFFLPVGLVVLVSVYLGGPVLWLVYRLPMMDTSSFGRARFILALALALAAGHALDRLLLTRDDVDRRPPTPVLRVEVGAVLAAVAIGLVVALLEAERLNQLRELAVDMIVPVGALLCAGLALWALRRRSTVRSPGVVAVVVAVMSVLELQWGAWGWVGWSGPELFYPDHAAFDTIEEDVGPGGPYRFVAPDLGVLPPNMGALLDLADARVYFPSAGGVGDLLIALGGGDTSGKRLKLRLPGDLDAGSPILDRLAVSYLIDPPDVAPRGLGREVPVPVPEERRLPVTVDTSDVPPQVRAVRVGLERVEPRCTAGWVEVRAGGDAVARRVLRGMSGDQWFPLADLEAVELQGGLTFASTHCPVRLTSDRARLSAPDPGVGLELVGNEGWTVYRRPEARPRASLARRVVEADARPVRQASRRSSQVAVVDGWNGPRDLAGGEARLVVDDADRVVVETRSDGPGLLVLADADAPGWHASVDGQAVDVFTVDGAFRGVRVPGGTARVEFRYLPDTLRWGLLVSAIAAVLLVSVVATGDRIGGPLTRSVGRGPRPRRGGPDYGGR